MNTEKIETVEMTPEEKAEYQAFKKAREKKEKQEKAKKERETYRDLIDETIDEAFPKLEALSKQLSNEKKRTYDSFKKALTLKGDIFGIRSDQRSNMFTNSDSTKRIILGCHETDGYDDTANEGIGKVKQYISSLAKDDESRMLVNQILRLLSKDQKGNLKAGKVLLLSKMAEESGNDDFQEGVRIIQEAYRPSISKYYIRAEKKDENGNWENVPLGMTEA